MKNYFLWPHRVITRQWVIRQYPINFTRPVEVRHLCLIRIAASQGFVSVTWLDQCFIQNDEMEQQHSVEDFVWVEQNHEQNGGNRATLSSAIVSSLKVVLQWKWFSCCHVGKDFRNVTVSVTEYKCTRVCSPRLNKPCTLFFWFCYVNFVAVATRWAPKYNSTYFMSLNPIPTITKTKLTLILRLTLIATLALLGLLILLNPSDWVTLTVPVKRWNSPLFDEQAHNHPNDAILANTLHHWLLLAISLP